MPRGGLKSSGGDWIVYSSALFFSFLLGNIASFMSAWFFLWHKSEMTNGTQWLLASKRHCEYQKDWSKTLLATPLQTYSLSKISLYCIYKEPDISRLGSFFFFFFSWCAYFLLTYFFLQSTKTREILLAQLMPTGRLYLHRISSLQLMHSQYIEMMKCIVIALIGEFRIENYYFFAPTLGKIAHLGIVHLNAHALNAMWC